MRFSLITTVLWFTATTAGWGEIAEEKLAKAECWLIFEGFAENAILSVDAPGGIMASVNPDDVIDVIELVSLKGATRNHVVRIYELRDATKFVCRLDRL